MSEIKAKKQESTNETNARLLGEAIQSLKKISKNLDKIIEAKKN